MFRWTAVLVLTGLALAEANAHDPVTFEGHSAGVPAVVFLDDGKILVTGSEDKTIKLWNVAEAKEIASLKAHEKGVQSLAGSPDGKKLASADDSGLVKVWDTETRKELLTLKDQKGDAAGLVFSPDGKLLAVGGGGFDKKTEKAWGEIHVWDANTGKEVAVISWPENRVNGLAISPDRALIAACSSNGSVALWDAATGKKKTDLGKNPKGGTGLAFSPDGKTLACGNFFGEMTIKFWDVTTGKETKTLESKSTVSAFSIKFLPDGKTLAVGGFDQKGVRDPKSRGAYVAVWDIEGGKERVLTGHLRGVTSISVNRDGTRLAVSGLDKNVCVWELTK